MMVYDCFARTVCMQESVRFVLLHLEDFIVTDNIQTSLILQSAQLLSESDTYNSLVLSLILFDDH